ncbi:MAG: secretin N-terminal domain-containing protein [Candidatus Omnitrophota bacterium]
MRKMLGLFTFMLSALTVVFCSAQNMSEPSVAAGQSVAAAKSSPKADIGEIGRETEGKTISLDFENAYLQNVLKAFSRQAGINFIASESIGNKPITVYLDGVTVDQAIESMLDANGLTFEKRSENVYLIKPRRGEAGADMQQGMGEKFETRVYRLAYIHVYDMSKAESGGSDMQLQTGTTSSETSGSSGASGTSEEVEIIKILKTLMSPQGKIQSDTITNSLIVTDYTSKFEVIEDVITQLDIEPIQVVIQAEIIETTTGAVKRIGLEYGTETQTAAIQYGKNSNITGSVDPVASTPFPFSESFIKDTFGKNLLNDGTFSYGTISASSLQVVLKLFANDSDTKYLARPKIMTLNNMVAVIRISENTMVGTTSIAQEQSNNVSTSPERVQTGILLKVTPSVNEKGDIFMYLEPSISRATASTFNTNYQDPQDRSASCTVMVREGETVVIGGLMETENVETLRKIPFLGDIPILGEPFKSRYKKAEDTELIIFITPRIIKRATNTENLMSRYDTEREYVIDQMLDKYDAKGKKK